MILIMSGAYLSAEFSSLFGMIPPSFLPVGNRRLFYWQAKSFGSLDDKIILTLPRDFVISEADAESIEQLGIDVLRLPDGLSLGEAIVYAINVNLAIDEPVRILHGDTLCGQLDSVDLNVVLSGTTSDHYRWAQCAINDNGMLWFRDEFPSDGLPRQVLCGYFTFENGGGLAKCLTMAEYDFILGLNYYSRDYGLSAEDCTEWLDYGHIHTYYRSKARLTTERIFNTVTTTPLWLQKSSIDQSKIKAEAHWFESLPSDIAMFTPRYLGQFSDLEGAVSYRLEYLYLSTLSELAIFGNLPAYSWQRIFSCIDDLMSKMQAIAAPAAHPHESSASYLEKTLSRLVEFSRMEGVDLTALTRFNGLSLPSLEKIVEIICSEIPDASSSDTTVMHGDLCYSNILFDPRSAQIRVIDPRGRTLDGKVSLYGDNRYDLAKLNHSVIGRYDSIIAGRYKLRRHRALDFELDLPHEGTFYEVEQQFKGMTFAGRSPCDPVVSAMTITLFLSMLPLHYDDKNRQYALLANALRLFVDLDRS